MDSISNAIGMIKEGLSMMKQNQIDERERWLAMLARWETRLSVSGDDWTWSDFEDASAARKSLEAQNLSTAALKRRAKALLRRDEASRSALIAEIEKGPLLGMSDRIRALVAAGEDPNFTSLLKDVQLAFARDRGITSIFDLLLELGADPAKIGFDALHQAIRFGTLDDVRAALPFDDPLARRPDADAPLEMAVEQGAPDILAALLDAVKAMGKIDDQMVANALGRAVQAGRADLVTLFLQRGANPQSTLDDHTFLYDSEILELCIAYGADVTKLSDLNLYHDDPAKIGIKDGVPAICGFTDRLVKAGWRAEHLDEFKRSQLRYVTKAVLIPIPDTNAPGFADSAGLFSGAANPEEGTQPYHLEMARTGHSSFYVRRKWKIDVPYPAWTMERFGQSTTLLRDGRWVQIAGEHEDGYDPDFVIFSDVIVHDGQGRMQVFFYLADIFPPTDFHTASLIDNDIWIIGSTGYVGTRRPNETPVYRLCLDDFSIHRVATSGAAVGWISRHSAQVLDGQIEVSGGWVFDGHEFTDNADRFRLDLGSLIWTRC